MNRCFAVLLATILLGQPLIQAESLPYLEGEVRRVKRELEQARVEISSIQTFLDKQDTLTQAIDDSIKEVKAYAAKVKKIRQQNLVKSSIKGLMEGFSIVSFGHGLVASSVGSIIASVLVELANSQIQNGWDSSFKTAIDDMQLHAQELNQIIDRLNRTKKLSAEAVRAHGYSTGHDLDDLGVLYRKIYLVEQGIKEAQEALGKFEAKVDYLISSAQASIQTLQDKQSDLEVELLDFSNRLAAEIEKRRQEKIAWALEETPPVVTPPVPQVEPKEPEESQLDQYRKILTASQTVLLDEADPLIAEIQTRSQAADDDYDFIRNEMNAISTLLTTGSIPEINADILRGQNSPMQDAAQLHQEMSALLPRLQGTLNLPGQIESLIDDIVDLETLRNELQGWKNMAETVNQRYAQMVGGTPPPDDDAQAWFESLKPGNYAGDTERFGWISDLQNDISRLERLSSVEVVQANISTCATVFQEESTRFAFEFHAVSEAYDTFLFEYARLEDLLETYNQILTDSGYGTRTLFGQPREVKLFNEDRFIELLHFHGFKFQNWEEFDDYIALYESTRTAVRALHPEFEDRWNRLYAAYAQLQDLQPLKDRQNDLFRVKNMEGAILTADPGNPFLLDTIGQDIPGLSYTFRNLPTLPDVDPENHVTPALKLRELMEYISAERSTWNTLAPSAYEAKVDELMRTLGEALAGDHQDVGWEYGPFIDDIRREISIDTTTAWMTEYWTTEPAVILTPPANMTVRVGDRAYASVVGGGAAQRFNWSRWGGIRVTEFSRDTMQSRIYDSTGEEEYWVRVSNFKGGESHQFFVTVVDDVPATLSASSSNHTGEGGDGSVSIQTDGSISWSAFTNNDWIQLGGPEAGIASIASAPHFSAITGQGNGEVSYHLAPNTTGDVREGVIKIAGEEFLIVQESVKIAFATYAGDQGIPGSEPGSDASGDGISNFLNYAFGLDPLADNTAHLPAARSMGKDDANTHFTLTYLRSPMATGLEYIVLASPDLIHWQTVNASHIFLGEEAGNWRYEAVLPMDENLHFYQLAVQEAH